MPIPIHLIIKIDGLAFDSLLADWRWLVSKDFTAVLMTAFGDLFLSDWGGCVHFLDLKSGTFKQIAGSSEEFDRLCEDREKRRTWFLGDLLMEVRKEHGDLTTGECYSCKKPLSLGGELEADNFERTDLIVHYSILGQLQKQAKSLPPGTKIGAVKIEPSDEIAKPKNGGRNLSVDMRNCRNENRI